MTEKVDSKDLKWFRHMEHISGDPLTGGVYKSDMENRGDALVFAY